MRTSFKFFLIPFLIKCLGFLVVVTCRVRFINDAEYRQRIENQAPFVLSLWHDCSTIAGWIMRNSAVTVMVSDSRDGEYVSRFANMMGIRTIRGSTSKGAGKAVKAGLKTLRSGQPIAITPDGPRGPRYTLSHGVLWFAAASQVPIIPIHIKADREWLQNSWDKQTFPKPFSTINVCFGDPVWIERAELEADLEAVAGRLQHVMMENVDLASRFD